MRHNMVRWLNVMTSLTIQIPDDMARSLQGIAASRQKTLEELAFEGLASFTRPAPRHPRGSPAALLQVMRNPPRLSKDDVDALDAAMASAQQPAEDGDIFSE